MTVFCLWNSHCTRVRFSVTVSCSDELAVYSCPLLCPQRWVAKAASGLFHCWFSLRSNNMATNLQSSLYIMVADVLLHKLWNAHVLAGNAARQWLADSGKPRTFILCEMKYERVYSRGVPHFFVGGPYNELQTSRCATQKN